MKEHLSVAVNDAIWHCKDATWQLQRSWRARILAPQEQEYFLEELSHLRRGLEEILNLWVSAKHSIRKSECNSAMLLGKGVVLQPSPLIQTITHEKAISEQLLRVHRMNEEKVTLLGQRIMEYNSALQQLIERRELRVLRRWAMELALFPTSEELPRMLDLQWLDELYGDEQEYLPSVVDPIRPMIHGRW